MLRVLPASIVMCLMIVGCASDSSSDAVQSVTSSLSIDGPGLSMYPSYDPAIVRYGIRTDDTATGTFELQADFGEDADVVVDGVAIDGTAIEISDVQPGDEIDVAVAVGDTSETYTFVYLPSMFPQIETERFDGDIADGHTFLTLRRIADPVVFETVIDENGVPLHQYVTELPSSDFKVQPNGTYSVARQTNPEGQPNHEIVVMNSEFEQIDALRNINLANTDDHDAILSEDGGRILMAYEVENQDDAPSGSRWHSDLEQVDADGNVVFEWSSRDHIPYADNVTANDIDYAHANSVFETADGNLLASFRNTSQIMKIDRPTGEVIWRLGGVSNDFEFIDDPYWGPCAQHNAQELDNGNILLFDNGSIADEDFLPNAADMCANPDDPDGVRIARPFSRAAEYEIDEDAMTATLVWSHDSDEEVYGSFTGSAQRLDNGNTLISWGTTTIGANPTSIVATEVDESGQTVWKLSAIGTDGNGDYFSYRAYRQPLLADN